MFNHLYRLKGNPLEPKVRPGRSRSDLDCQRQSNLYRYTWILTKGELASYRPSPLCGAGYGGANLRFAPPSFAVGETCARLKINTYSQDAAKGAKRLAGIIRRIVPAYPAKHAVL